MVKNRERKTGIKSKEGLSKILKNEKLDFTNQSLVTAKKCVLNKTHIPTSLKKFIKIKDGVIFLKSPKQKEDDIKKITNSIIKLSNKYPDLRFGQLINFVFGNDDIFYFSNKKILSALNKKLK